MKVRRVLSILLSLMLFATLVTGCGGSKDQQAGKDSKSGPEYKWKFVHEETDGDIQDRYAKEFKRILEEKSEGRIEIDVVPVGQLGDATQQCELLQNGGIEFACVSPGNTGTIVPENQLFSLHFLFPDDINLTKKVLNESKALNEDLSACYEDKNIRVLSYWTEGFMEWTTSKSVDTPVGFKGLKMRTMPSPMIVAAYEAYGANPTPVPYMEVYSGLQLNMIEGQENPLDAIATMKFYEVQDYLTLAHASMYVTTTATNPAFFDSLPPDIQQVVLDTVDEMRDISFNMQQENNDNALKEIKDNSDIKIVELNAEQRAAFKAASKSAYDVYVNQTGAKGKTVLEKLMKEVAALEK